LRNFVNDKSPIQKGSGKEPLTKNCSFKGSGENVNQMMGIWTELPKVLNTGRLGTLERGPIREPRKPIEKHNNVRKRRESRRDHRVRRKLSSNRTLQPRHVVEKEGPNLRDGSGSLAGSPKTLRFSFDLATGDQGRRSRHEYRKKNVTGSHVNFIRELK